MTDSTSGDLVQYNAPDFGVIPSELMCDQKLSRDARLLGCLMWTYRNKDTGVAWPSQKTLGARLGVSARSIQRWMAELRERKWMESKHRISVDPEYHGNPGALIHTLKWSRGPEQAFPSNKGKGDKLDVPYTTSGAGTTRQPTAQEHTKEQTNRTESSTTRSQDLNSSQTANPISEAEKALLDAGVYPRKVTQLMRDYSEEVILGKVQHFSGGALVRAIEEDWQPKEPTKKTIDGKEYIDFADANEKFCPGGCGSLVANCTCGKFMTYDEYQSTIAPESERGGKQTVGEALGVSPPKVNPASE